LPQYRIFNTFIPMNLPLLRISILLIIIFTFARAQAGIVTLDDSQGEYAVSAEMDILEDKTGKLSITEITSGRYDDRFMPSPGVNPAFPQGDSHYWMRIRLRNNSNNNDWLLELRNGYMAVFDLYTPLGDGTYKETKGGFYLPYKDSRHYNYEFITQPLPLQPDGTGIIYVRASSPTPVVLSLYIASHKRFVQRATALEYALGIYYGIILVLFVYSLFNFIALKNRSYLWYGLYVLSIALLIFCIDGRMYRYITSDLPYFNLKLLDIIMMFSIVFGFAYGQSFLDTKRYIPRFDKLMQVMKIISLVLAICVIPFIPVEHGVEIAKAAPIPALVVLMTAAYLCFRKGHGPARLFLIGFGVFAVGGAVSNLAFAAVIPSNIYTIYAIHVGSALEAIILVFGLSQQMRLLKRDKESAQETIIRQLKENERLQTRVNRELEQKVRERTAEIESQKVMIEEKNKDITDSILYARRIQQAILPGSNHLDKLLNDHFVLYKPKDIVSGDFYWVEEREGKVLFAAVDCTGHGVPGAFVSMLGYNGLNQAVNEKGITDPSAILSELDNYMHSALKHSLHQSTVKDGMDISLCCIDRKARKLLFSGAVNPAYIVRSSEIIILKGDRFPIGGALTEEKKIFTTQEFGLQEGDSVYVFSDGYADQFGGAKGKKFMSRQFKELLLQVRDKPMNEQKSMLDARLSQWRGSLEQVDDVLVIGVRI
jgi:two-component system, sensor histidine kinase LadS